MTRSVFRVRGPGNRSALRWAVACFVASLGLGSIAATAQVVINEIDYDQPGTDTAEFIELKNTGATPVNLDSFSIKLIDGATLLEYGASPIDLPSVALAAGDYFVISGDASAVANTDFVVSGLTIQDGAPDAVQLLDGAAIADTVSYEGTTTGFSEGTGASAADSDVTEFVGLSRAPDGADTDDNDTDIALRCITPGTSNAPSAAGCTAPLIVRATKTDSLVSVLGVSGDVDADGVADPGDTISYTVEVTALGADAPTVVFDDLVDTNTTFATGSVRVTPIAFDDAYDVTCNVSITVPAGSGVLANDTDPDAVPPLSNTGVTAVGLDTGATSGSVTLAADGSFTYEPAPGFTGTDTFAYTARDTDSLDSVETGVVSLDVGSDCIWFIDKSGSGADQGTLADPFLSIASFNTAQGTGTGPQTGDLILLYTGAYTTGANLLASQTLAGQGVSFTGEIATAGITLAPNSDSIPSTAGTRPTIASSDNGIDLASGNTVRGLDIGNTSGAGFAGTGVGTLSVDTLAISGTGGALDITTGTLAVTLDSITSTATAVGVEGIFLSGVGGTLNVTGGTSLAGLMDDGIQLVSNTATLDFDGTVSITTGSGGGILASGGTLDIFNASTTVSATGAPALDITSTALRTNGVSGITFASLSSTSSSTEGIDLNMIGDDLSVSGTTTITNSETTGIRVQNGGTSSFDFGATTVTDTSIGAGANANGIDLSTGNSSTAFTFDNLSVTTDAGFGLKASNSGTVNLTGTAATVNATGAPALDITNTIGQTGGAAGWTFGSVTSTNSTTFGVKFDDIDQAISLSSIDIDSSSTMIDNGIELRSLTGGATITSGHIIFTGTNNGNGLLVVSSPDVTIQGTAGACVQATGVKTSCFEITGMGTGSGTQTETSNNGHGAVVAVDSDDLAVKFCNIHDVGDVGNGDGHLDPGVFVNELDASTLTVTDSFFEDLNGADALFIGDNDALYTGTVTLDFSRNTVRGAPTGAGATETALQFSFNSVAGATLLATIDGNRVLGARHGFQVNIDLNAGNGIGNIGNSGTGAGGRNVISISSNTIEDVDGTGIGVDVGDNSVSKLTVDDNSLDAATGAFACTATAPDPDVPIEIEMRPDDTAGLESPVLDVFVRNNTVFKSALPATGCDNWDGGDAGIMVAGGGATVAGSAPMGVIRSLISGNDVNNVDDWGIYVHMDESGTHDSTVLNNIVRADTDGIRLDVSEGPDAPTLTVWLDGNRSPEYDVDEPSATQTTRLACEGACPETDPVTTNAEIKTILEHNGNLDENGSTPVTVTFTDGATVRVVTTGTVSPPS